MQISPQTYCSFIPCKNKYAKVNTNLVQCWNCLDGLKIDENLSGKGDFYGHMVAVKSGESPYIQQVALHVLCSPCNRDFLDRGILSYIDECPFKCGSNENRQRIVVHASGIILKKEPMSLTQINQIRNRQRLEYCLEILKTFAYGMFGQIVSSGVTLVAITIMLSPTVGIIILIGKMNELFQEKVRP